MSISQRKLSAMLIRLIKCGPVTETHSQTLCSRCFNLVERVDGIEIELADIKVELLQLFEATLAHRRPTLARKDAEMPTVREREREMCMYVCVCVCV